MLVSILLRGPQQWEQVRLQNPDKVRRVSSCVSVSASEQTCFFVSSLLISNLLVIKGEALSCSGLLKLMGFLYNQ